MKAISRKDLRNFGLILGLVFFLIGTRMFFKYSRPLYLCLPIAGLLFIIFGLLSPLALNPAYKAWMKAAHVAGWVTTRVMLIIVFYVILTPMGLINRLMRKDLLDIRVEKDRKSYWIEYKSQKNNIKQYEKQF